MSEFASYLGETGLVYVLYRLKEDLASMEEEGRLLLSNVPLDEQYVKRLFFGEGEEDIFTKTTLPVPFTDGKNFTQIIDVAVLSHMSLKEKALEVFDGEMKIAAQRKQEQIKAALSFKPYFKIPELSGVCITGSLSEGRHPAPWCDIDFIIFTERELAHRFLKEWRRKPQTKRLSWTEFDYESIDINTGHMPPQKEILFEKEGAFDIDIVVVKPSAWVPALKAMPFGKLQFYLEILEDCYPVCGDAYIRNFYKSVK